MIIPKIIFLVPYRNRGPQKVHFDIYMKYILEDYKEDDYEIFYVHQLDKRPFNRGAMKNIGFLAIKSKYPNNYKNITLVFNDIDTIPCIKNILNYETNNGVVKHFYGFTFALGGIFSITGGDFEKCNGFPNYWGWGLEDNAMNKRVINNNIIIDRSTFFTIGSHNIIQCMDKPLRLINDKESSIQFSDEGITDIKNLKFYFKDEYIQVENFNTRENLNINEFYSKDISKPGSHQAARNVLKTYTTIIPHKNSRERWKMF
jgi:hypothetical protein